MHVAKSCALIATLSVAIAANAAPPPPAAQHLVPKKGHCQMTVPAGWKVDALIKSSASAPDHSASAVVSFSDRLTTLADVKPIVQSTLQPVKTLESSPQRLWYQYRTSHAQGTGWYVGVVVKGGICGAQIAFKHAAQEAMAKQIALSVSALP